MEVILTLSLSLLLALSCNGQGSDYQADFSKSMTDINNLHDAAAKNDVAAVTGALQNDPMIINTRDSNSNTPLQIAVKSKAYEVVQLLLSRGAHNGTDQTTADSRSLLHNAVLYGDAKLVAMILGDSIGVGMMNMTDINSSTPLHYAAMLGKLSIVKLLLGKGANTEFKANGGLTPLIVATQNNQLKIVSILLAYNANIKAGDYDGNTPLHHAAANNFVEILKALLADSRVNANLSGTNYPYRQPLHCAAASLVDTTDAMTLLLSKKADINGQDSRSATPLSLAAAKGNVPRIDFLIKNGATINCFANCGKDPLSAAILGENDGSDGCSETMVDTVEFLLAKGVGIRQNNFNNHLCDVVRLATKTNPATCPIIWIAQVMQSFLNRNATTKVVCSYSDCSDKPIQAGRSGARHPSADPYDFRVCLDRRPDIRAGLKYLATFAEDSSSWKNNRTIALQNMKCAPIACPYTCFPGNAPYWNAKTLPGVDDDLIAIDMGLGSTTKKPSSSGSRGTSGSRKGTSGAVKPH